MKQQQWQQQRQWQQQEKKPESPVHKVKKGRRKRGEKKREKIPRGP